MPDETLRLLTKWTEMVKGATARREKDLLILEVVRRDAWRKWRVARYVDAMAPAELSPWVAGEMVEAMERAVTDELAKHYVGGLRP